MAGQASIHLAALFVFLYGSTLAGQVVPPPAPARPTDVPGTHIVRFRQGVTASERSVLIRGAGANLRANFNMANAASVEVPSAAALAGLRNHPRVLAVYANHSFFLSTPQGQQLNRGRRGSRPRGNDATTAAASGSQVVPAGVSRIGAAPGTLTWTGAGVGVAVVDTGLDFGHPDLGLATEVAGVNSFNAQGGSCQDIHGHGTHVAGIIAARNNTIDVVGVAPDATLYCVNVFQPDPLYEVIATDESLIAGLEWIATHANQVNPPIRTVNMSLGRPRTPDDTPDHPLHVIVRTLRDNGITVVVSAGNDANVEVSDMVPASYPEVMAVASTSAFAGLNGYDPDTFKPCLGELNVLADSASYFTTDGSFIGGTGVTVSAPGEEQEDIFDFFGTCLVESIGVLSTWPEGTTEASGTSMAAPLVTGVVALMWQKELSMDHSLGPENARTRIRASVDRVAAAPLDSPVDGYTFDGEREGILWAPAAVGDAPPPPPDTPPTVSISSPANGSTFTTADTISLAATATDPEDGDIASSLVWTSDRQGEIGTGASFSRGLTSGVHLITATATDSGGNVERRSVTITVNQAPQPDLIISTLTVPATAAAGAAITVTDTTRNQGTATADPSATRFYLSANNTLDASDVSLGERAVATLNVGQSSAASTSLTIPATTAGGSYYVIAKADAGDALPELLETNNTRAGTILIGPDLIVSSLSAPAAAGAGATITVTDTIRNQGYGAADATATRLYLSTNNTLDAADSAIGERTVPTLAPNQTNSGSTLATIPPDTSTGIYYIIAKADGNDALGETVETNNTRIGLMQIGPDLTVWALTVPTAAAAGSTVTVTDTTKNQGGGTAGSSATLFYLSTNTLFDAADVMLGSRTVPGLAAGQTSSAPAAIAIPPGTAVGAYYIVAKADGDNLVPETVETNNTRAASIQIGPDLAISALAVPTAAAAVGTVSAQTVRSGPICIR
ncbi:MAG TPA: CARDB domain-containing protein, partial [Terriglobia bacterium]